MAAASDDTAASGWQVAGRWARAASLLVIGIGSAFGLWWLVYTHGVVQNAHRQNFRDLAVAARGLELWPDSVAGVARANFTRTRLHRAAAVDAAAGWPLEFTQTNPGLGELRILYALRAAGPQGGKPCAALQSEAPGPGDQAGVAFVSSSRPDGGQEFVVNGDLKLADIWLADMPSQIGTTKIVPEQVVAHLRDDGELAAALEAGGTPKDASVVCYRVSVELRRLVPIRSVAPKFSNLLIARQDGTVIAQIGRDRLPVTNIGKLPHVGSQFANLVNEAATLVAKESKPNDTAKPVDFADALEPLDTTIATRTYTAFTYPLKLDNCGGATRAASQPPGSDLCVAIGLMPAGMLSSDALRPPPAVAIGFLLTALLVLALLPILRLALLGPADSIRASEAAMLPVLLTLAAALATFSVLLVLDIERHRAAASALSRTVAEQMGAAAGTEIAKMVVASRDCYDSGAIILKVATKYPPTRPEESKYPAISPEEETSAAGHACWKYPLENLPAIEFLALFGNDGRQAQGTTFVNAGHRGTNRANIGGRDYLHHLQGGQFLYDLITDSWKTKMKLSQRFGIGQIRSQTDGTNRTVVAVSVDDWKAAGINCRHCTLAAVGDLRTFLSPVLPRGQQFMVVDTSNPDLPVVLHSVPARAGIEQLTSDVGIRYSDIVRLRGIVDAAGAERLPPDKPPGAITFAADYYGQTREFAAVTVLGTPWVVLVSYAGDDIDAVAARSTSRALVSWSSLAIMLAVGIAVAGLLPRRLPIPARIAGIAVALFLTVALSRSIGGVAVAAGVGVLVAAIVYWSDGNRAGRHLRILWPSRTSPLCARRLWRRLAAIAAVSAALVLAVGDGLTALLLGLACAVASVGLVAWTGQRSMPGAAADPTLRPGDWRRYLLSTAALLLCLGVVPAIGVWRDAAELARGEATSVDYHSALQAIDARRDAGVALQKAFDLNPTPYAFGVTSAPGVFPPPAAPTRWQPRRVSPGGYAAELGSLQTGAKIADWIACPAAPDIWLCVGRSRDGREQIGLRPGLDLRSAPDARSWAFTGMVTVALLVVIGLALLAMLRALLGYRIPFEAVTRPRLVLSGPGDIAQGILALGSRTLLVAPQAKLREAVEAGEATETIDLADLAVTLPVAARPVSGRIVVSGLEMVIRLSDRRMQALQTLERFEHWAADEPGRQLVVIAEMAPLERIIDAHDEEREGRNDAAGEQSREQLRWSLLFEDFVTFTFAAVDKVDLTGAAGRDPAAVAAAREMRWLPGHVIDGIVGQELSHKLPGARAVYPLEPADYKAAYSATIWQWADSLRATSPEASVDYLRSMAIEHYQQCWSASTWAERLVLDALAHGRFVNMTQALALRSLVRRGLVVFDPEPKLMNLSFGLFVRQSERPGTISVWRKSQPKGGWAKARGPVTILVPVLLVGILVLALWTGEPLTALAPLLVAGGPLLIRTLVNRLERTV